MIIYFAITTDMLPEPEKVDATNSCMYTLREGGMLSSTFDSTPGKVMDGLPDGHVKSYVICKAILDDTDAFDLMNCGLGGGRVVVDVNIVEMTRINQ